MAYAVISDVHANFEALRAVLRDIRDRGIRDICFLGDAVGYGPDPNECVELLRKECKILLAGNHDYGAAGLLSADFFNPYALEALIWTTRVMSRENLRAVKALPVMLELGAENITLAHSSPFEPDLWHYIFSAADADANFGHFKTPLCFVGHSHVPLIFEKHVSGEIALRRGKAVVQSGNRYIINTGSVGQPRDRDARASYAVIEGERIDIVRVSYDIKATQRRMTDTGLPDFLITRLSLGI